MRDGARFKDIRLRHGLSREKCGKRLDLSPSTIRDWENGARSTPKGIGPMLRSLKDDDSSFAQDIREWATEPERRVVSAAPEATSDADASPQGPRPASVSGHITLDQLAALSERTAGVRRRLLTDDEPPSLINLAEDVQELASSVWVERTKAISALEVRRRRTNRANFETFGSASWTAIDSYRAREALQEHREAVARRLHAVGTLDGLATELGQLYHDIETELQRQDSHPT